MTGSSPHRQTFVIGYEYESLPDEGPAGAVVNAADAHDAVARLRRWDGGSDVPRVLSVEPLGERVVLADADQFSTPVPEAGDGG